LTENGFGVFGAGARLGEAGRRQACLEQDQGQADRASNVRQSFDVAGSHLPLQKSRCADLTGASADCKN